MAGIEGTVIIRVLIDTSGKIKKMLVQESDNDKLNDAALTAIGATVFTPAIQKGKPIDCWVSIPIRFKLTGDNKSFFESFFDWLF